MHVHAHDLCMCMPTTCACACQRPVHVHAHDLCTCTHNAWQACRRLGVPLVSNQFRYSIVNIEVCCRLYIRTPLGN